MIISDPVGNTKSIRKLRRRQAVMLKKQLESLHGIVSQFALGFRLANCCSRSCSFCFQRRILLRKQRNLLFQKVDYVLAQSHHTGFFSA
jgi:hypothetical protein